MQFKTIQYAEANRIATITLNRPDKRNAISYELIDDLLGGLMQAAESSAHVLILTGAGTAFCSGMDLENLKQLTGRTHEQNIRDSETMARLFRTLYDFPKPAIAAVNGAAIAGGTGLATLCDFTLAVPDAKFGYTEVRIGFVPAIVLHHVVFHPVAVSGEGEILFTEIDALLSVVPDLVVLQQIVGVLVSDGNAVAAVIFEHVALEEAVPDAPAEV